MFLSLPFFVCCELASACHRGSGSPLGLFSRSVNKVCCCRQGDAQSHQRSRLRTSTHSADGGGGGGSSGMGWLAEGKMLGISEARRKTGRQIARASKKKIDRKQSFFQL